MKPKQRGEEEEYEEKRTAIASAGRLILCCRRPKHKCPTIFTAELHTMSTWERETLVRVLTYTHGASCRSIDQSECTQTTTARAKNLRPEEEAETPAVASPESPFPSDWTMGWVSYNALLERLGRVGSL